MENPSAIIEEKLQEFTETSKSRRCKRISEEQEFIRNLTMGIEETLHIITRKPSHWLTSPSKPKSHPMIKDVKMCVSPPVSTFMLTSWERRHGLRLPSDLRNYYSSINGLRVTWNLVYADEVLKIGDLCINSLEQLIPIDTILEAKETELVSDLPNSIAGECLTIPLTDLQTIKSIEFENGGKDLSKTGGRFSVGSKVNAFQLDSSHPDSGTICLVYPIEVKVNDTASGNGAFRTPNHFLSKVVDPDIQIWFLDRSFQWHFLAPTFHIFYRMALFHLGLPEWPYRFTRFGISSWIEQIFWLVAPNLLKPIKNLSYPNTDSGIWCGSQDIPPEALKPNPTYNILNLNMFKKKKKEKDLKSRLKE